MRKKRLNKPRQENWRSPFGERAKIISPSCSGLNERPFLQLMYLANSLPGERLGSRMPTAVFPLPNARIAARPSAEPRQRRPVGGVFGSASV